ncbi:MAG: rRNA maturation RNase YbeY [Patescibacteria group bacterium]|nr:rRNA maturation RNase YbeY [Patescibacteria group bacterium]
MIKVNIFNENQYQLDEQVLKTRVKKILNQYEIDDVSVDLSFVDTVKITQLNEEELHRQGQTDVLSFPHYSAKDRKDFPLIGGKLLTLGDIVICYQTAEKESIKFKNTLTDQICFYVEHGLLHLLGYHHY